MKKDTVIAIGRLVLGPALLIALGVVLLLNPDAASAVVARLVGWVCLAAAAVCGLGALLSERKGAKPVLAVVLLAAGLWLMSHPLRLAAWIGRFVGLVILLNGIPDLVWAVKEKRSLLLSGIEALVGLVLILLPMTTSRLVFMACGALVAVIGIAMLADRLRARRWLPGGDSDIVDAL